MEDSKNFNENEDKTRIQILLKHPNPIFENWLKEWLKEAEQKNSKSKYKIKEALNSLKKFPLPLATGRDCGILKGFGTNICQLLDLKLNDYKKLNLDEYNQSINYEADIQKITKSVQKTKENSTTGSVQSSFKSKSPIKSKSKNDIPAEVNDEEITFNPGCFKIVLLVDTQETSGKCKKSLDDTRFYLSSRNILYEVRRLSVGDFAWICKDDNQNELILPYIVERKRMDDFASSIRDGRFHEQKFRLSNCALDNIIYLIESYGNNQHVGLPMSTLLQAAVNTQIHSEFQIKFTDNHKESMMYLATLTEILIEKFKDKRLTSIRKEDIKPCNLQNSFAYLMKFKTFQDSSVKTRRFTVREIFIKQLIQLKYLTVEKALAITDIYPTPRLLINAYEKCTTEKEAEELLAKIQFGILKRPVGANISKTIYQLYCCDFEI